MTDHQSRTSELLRAGEIEVKGRMPWSSNGTFLVELALADQAGLAIYKPGRGERPLHDFPAGLYRREWAVFEVAGAIGWEVVPETVIRPDAPLGEGSLQHFVDADFEAHYFTLVEEERHHLDLQRICLLDFVTNNTDRKGGHCLVDEAGRVWAIDNGLSFHAQFKLRTVIWEWAGEPIPAELLDDLHAFCRTGLPAALDSVLDPFERDAALSRTRSLLQAETFPIDPTGHRYPWPLV